MKVKIAYKILNQEVIFQIIQFYLYFYKTKKFA